MAEPFGMHGKITVTKGNGDALVELLLAAAAGLEELPDCLLYLVSRDPSEPEAVWVTEVSTTAKRTRRRSSWRPYASRSPVPCR